MAYPILQWRAATVLDRTHAVGERGPRIYGARKLVAAWLDTGASDVRKVRRAVDYLERIAEEEGSR